MSETHETTFTGEKLTGILSNEETTVEQKIELILSEHNADINGLKSKNKELLDKLAKGKSDIENLGKEKEELVGKYATLEEELKKNNPEDLKKLLENQFAEKENGYRAEIESLTAERNLLKANDLKRLLNESINDGAKDLNFMDGLREGFIALVLARNNFEPKEIDGVTRFYNAEMKEPKDVMKEFALSNEGKAFIKTSYTGGGSTGSGAKSNTTTINGENPWAKGHINLTKQMEITKQDKALAERLKAEARAN